MLVNSSMAFLATVAPDKVRFGRRWFWDGSIMIPNGRRVLFCLKRAVSLVAILIDRSPAVVWRDVGFRTAT